VTRHHLASTLVKNGQDSTNAFKENRQGHERRISPRQSHDSYSSAAHHMGTPSSGCVSPGASRCWQGVSKQVDNGIGRGQSRRF